MAGDWMKVEKVTPDKAEIFAIADRLGIDPDAAFGKCFRVWRWFDDHTTDGNAKSVTKALVDRFAGVTGFADAMELVGWLIADSDGIVLHSFDKHTGKTAKVRAETARRVSKHKSKKATGDSHRDIIPRPIRKAVMDRDSATCVYCGREQGEYVPPETAHDAQIHIDHVIPESGGGSNDLSNLACACSVCNLYKSNRTPDECGLQWPEHNGKRLGNKKTVTDALPREEKRRVINPLPPLPEILLPIEESITEWVAYKRKYKPRGLKALVSRLERRAVDYGVEAVAAALQRAMAQGYQGWDFDEWFAKAATVPAKHVPKVYDPTTQKYDPVRGAYDE